MSSKFNRNKVIMYKQISNSYKSLIEQHIREKADVPEVKISWPLDEGPRYICVDENGKEREEPGLRVEWTTWSGKKYYFYPAPTEEVSWVDVGRWFWKRRVKVTRYDFIPGILRAIPTIKKMK